MRYIRYRRKSSEALERQALSTESQELELKRKFPDLEIVADFEESKSAFHPYHRPKFQQMIEMLQEQKADGILAWHPDRLSRNEIDAGTITYLIRTGVIKDMQFGSYYFDNSPEGIMILQNVMSHSQYNSARLSKDVRRGLDTKAKKGWCPSSWTKPGYMWDKTAEKGNKTILKDPLRFPLIEKAFRLMLTGNYSPAKIHKELNEWGYTTPKRKRVGGNKMSRSAIYDILRDKFYAGFYKYPKNSGEWQKGEHPTIITIQEFDRIQILLGQRGRPRPKKHDFAFAGDFKCGECGATITFEEKWQIICSNCKNKFTITKNGNSCTECGLKIELMKNPKILHYIYCHCTKRKNPNCTQKSITLENLEAQIDKMLSRIEISEGFKNWAIKYLNEAYDIESTDRNAILTSLDESYSDVVKRIDNLVKLKISPQNSDNTLLTDDEFKKQKESLIQEKELLEEKRRETEVRVENWLELSEKTFSFACYARRWFTEGDNEKKREIVRGIGSNLILKDKIVHIDIEKPLNFIAEAKNEVPEISLMFEPKKYLENTTKTDVFYTQFSSLLPG